jgi:hypothetical protein
LLYFRQEIRDIADIGTDDREACRHGLDHAERHLFGIGAQSINIELTERQLGLLQKACEGDAFGDPELGCQSFELRTLTPLPDDHESARPGGLDLGEDT